MKQDVANELADLEGVVPRLRSQGYEVYLEPSANLLPPFMEGYRPPAIAVRGDRKLAIEVLRDDPGSRQRLEEAHQRFEDRADWELRVYWLNPLKAWEPLETASRDGIDRTIRTVERLAEEGQMAPALLTAWAALEALGRTLLPEKLARPQTASDLVEAMAFEGQIMPADADFLRTQAEMRNRVAHGALDIQIRAEDLGRFVEVLKDLQVCSAEREPPAPAG
jgi:uncharacterized protein YutE (UPF0331/DUF86 family)